MRILRSIVGLIARVIAGAAAGRYAHHIAAVSKQHEVAAYSLPIGLVTGMVGTARFGPVSVLRRDRRELLILVGALGAVLGIAYLASK